MIQAATIGQTLALLSGVCRAVCRGRSLGANSVSQDPKHLAVAEGLHGLSIAVDSLVQKKLNVG